MNVYAYPAVLQPEDVGGYSVEFPDLLGCCTEGDSLEEAVLMARDALGLYLYSLEQHGDPIPPASPLDTIRTDPGSFASLIDIDMLAYRQRYDNRAVKKTLTIPAWLNTMAEVNNVNFSQILQSALKERLGLADQR